jgi:hypothetical protein
MRKVFVYGYVGLIIGTLFEIVSFLFAHLCQLILGSLNVATCRYFVMGFYYMATLFNFVPLRIGYLISIVIIILLFGLIGLGIGFYKERH